METPEDDLARQIEELSRHIAQLSAEREALAQQMTRVMDGHDVEVCLLALSNIFRQTLDRLVDNPDMTTVHINLVLEEHCGAVLEAIERFRQQRRQP
jgi:hypothetical protein